MSVILGSFFIGKLRLNAPAEVSFTVDLGFGKSMRISVSRALLASDDVVEDLCAESLISRKLSIGILRRQIAQGVSVFLSPRSRFKEEKTKELIASRSVLRKQIAALAPIIEAVGAAT